MDECLRLPISKIGPNDKKDLDLPMACFRVQVGGSVHVKHTNGKSYVLLVESGQIVDIPVIRLFATGTTASGFEFSREPSCQYSPGRSSSSDDDGGGGGDDENIEDAFLLSEGGGALLLSDGSYLKLASP